jgi:tetratricopeptide (TPR) repeat protein
MPQNKPFKRARVEPLTADVRDAFLKQATAYHSAGRFDLAAPLYEHVESHNPDALAATYFRALMDVETGRLEEARVRLRRVARSDPGSVEAQYSLGYVYQELGLWERAVEQYRRVLVLSPDRIGVKSVLAKALEILGQFDESLAILRELASTKSAHLRALCQIAQMMPGAITLEEQAEMQAAASEISNPAPVRISLHFALGELLEREKKYDAAFVAFAAGNLLRREHLDETIDEPQKPVIAPPSARPRKWHPQRAAEEHSAEIANAKRTFTREFIGQHEGLGDITRAPIFIVGMPRSGSTLIEQILSSHKDVTGLGEANALWSTVSKSYPYADQPQQPKHFRALAKTYLEKLHALGWGKSPFVVDKMLGNYMAIGMIHLMLPNATILHSVRDPVDNCLACFRKLFKSGNETTFDLADIGAQYVRYREMMDHWDAVLPGRIVTVRHEDLVESPDEKIRWLVTKACGLKWDDACLRFYETDRPVRTASIAQVRQPIFKSSVERWRRYEAHLGPLFEALGPYAPVSGGAG